MIDINFILNNPEKFNIAMANRNCENRAEEIINLHNIQKKQKQITEIDNSLKKVEAKIFFLEKRKEIINANEPLDEIQLCKLISEECELKKNKFEIMFNYTETLLEMFDATVNYIKYKDEQERKLFRTYGIELPNYWELENGS
jgi:seryl-tRNA synthetase